MTLLLYARRKGWPLEGISVELSHERVHAKDCEECEGNDNIMVDLIRRHIVARGPLDNDQVERLLEIAQRCPIHSTLSGGPTIVDEMELLPLDQQVR